MNFLNNFITKKITRQKLDSWIKNYNSDKLTLEVGSFGNNDFRKYFPNRVGIDIRPGIGVDIVASVYNLPFSDNKFDLILCIAVLEHLENPQKGIQEMRRVLKK